MKLRKTDRRFKLYNYGFTCFVEFDGDNWLRVEEWRRACQQTLGEEFFEIGGRVYRNGKWRKETTKKPDRYWNPCKRERIYFRGDKVYTMMLMAVPPHREGDFYL